MPGCALTAALAAMGGRWKLFILYRLSDGPLHFAALRSFFKFLTRRCGWKKNPLLEVQLPKQEKGLPITLTVAQVEAMLELPLKTPKEKQAPAFCVQKTERNAVLEVVGGVLALGFVVATIVFAVSK